MLVEPMFGGLGSWSLYFGTFCQLTLPDALMSGLISIYLPVLASFCFLLVVPGFGSMLDWLTLFRLKCSTLSILKSKISIINDAN
jgi:hypothetical protein